MKFKTLLSNKEWWIEESSFDLDKINLNETLFSVGNGYLGTRGSLEEGHTASRPGTFINGIFDPHDADVNSLVNAPDWLPCLIWVNGERLSLQTARIIEHRRILDMKHGLLYRLTKLENARGLITRYESVRYANFFDQHSMDMAFTLTAENYKGEITIINSVNGHVFNLDRMPVYKELPKFDPEVKWEKWTKSRHLKHVHTNCKDHLYLEMQTIDHPYRLGYAMAVNFDVAAEITTQADFEQIHHVAKIKVEQGQTIYGEKLVSIFTNRDVSDAKLASTCSEHLSRHLKLSADERFLAHKKAWEQKWADSDCEIVGDTAAQKAVRFNLYHLLICANPHDERVNIGAKCLTGEGYKGHIFWDTEIFMLPFYIYTQPETAKALLMYRYHTLTGAKDNALTTNFVGARYPWEAADTGTEETPKWTPDGKDRFWTGEEEIHVTADVVYGILTYYSATQDLDFLLDYGAEILFETARFWVSRLEYNQLADRYELNCVIGPDEFHEHINNNTYTNRLAQWNLERAYEIFNWLHTEHKEKLLVLQEKIKLDLKETINWKNIAAKIYISCDSKKYLIEEFEGYFKLKDLPITAWDENGMPQYPEGRNHFNCNDIQLIKQADVVMLLYVLPDEFDDQTKKANYEFYEKRTLHKSSLSPSIYSIMAIEVDDTKKVLQYFKNAAWVDLIDNQGNAEWGIHIASAGGIWQAMVFGFGGMRIKNRKLTFKPWLPKEWQQIKFKIKWHAGELSVVLNRETIEFLWQCDEVHSLEIEVRNTKVILKHNEKRNLKFL